MARLTDQEVIAMCEEVGAGNLTVQTPDGSWLEIYAENVVFKLSNGYSIIVFNDCGEWDYVDGYVDTEGVYHNVDCDGELGNWQPKHFARWGITTGYMNKPLDPKLL